MNNVLITIKLTLISIFLTSLILISIVSYNIYQKEKSRGNIKIESSIIFKGENIKSKFLLNDKRKKQIDLENLNSKIIEEKKETIREKDFTSIKNKIKIENELKKQIEKVWKKPFNYRDGDGCFISLYFTKDNNYRYQINECVNNNAIVKRSIEISLLDILENYKIKELYKYKKSNELRFFVY